MHRKPASFTDASHNSACFEAIDQAIGALKGDQTIPKRFEFNNGFSLGMSLGERCNKSYRGSKS
jgi:hypothetical protein